jgi:erythromycin esterase-like protein
VVDHLETARPTYPEGISDSAIGWGAQAQDRAARAADAANTVSRDRSMADNVEWITDHNPNAKIVIWAHNGHVGK